MSSEEIQQLETRLLKEMHAMELRITSSIGVLSKRVSRIEGKLDNMRIFMLVMGGMMTAILAAALQVSIRHIF
jgi:tetrahydromethanopterin S-methyltransferase subunit B